LPAKPGVRTPTSTVQGQPVPGEAPNSNNIATPCRKKRRRSFSGSRHRAPKNSPPRPRALGVARYLKTGQSACMQAFCSAWGVFAPSLQLSRPMSANCTSSATPEEELGVWVRSLAHRRPDYDRARRGRALPRRGGGGVAVSAAARRAKKERDRSSSSAACPSSTGPGAAHRTSTRYVAFRPRQEMVFLLAPTGSGSRRIMRLLTRSSGPLPTGGFSRSGGADPSPR